jgi:hypothetical protein
MRIGAGAIAFGTHAGAFALVALILSIHESRFLLRKNYTARRRNFPLLSSAK